MGLRARKRQTAGTQLPATMFFAACLSLVVLILVRADHYVREATLLVGAAGAVAICRMLLATPQFVSSLRVGGVSGARCSSYDSYDEVAGHAILAELSHARRFNQWMAEMIRPYAGHSVLEIGAGIGNLTSVLLPRDRYVATDVDRAHLDVLRSRMALNGRLEVGSVNVCDPVDFKSYRNAFDTVVCLNVLEHITDAAQALGNILSALRPGGRAILLVPQGTWLYSDLDREIGHVKRYTRRQLIEEVSGAGFWIERLFDFNRCGVPGWFVNCRLLGRTRLPEVQLGLYNLLVPIVRRIDPWLPWNGLSLVAIVRRMERGDGAREERTQA